MIFFLPNRKLQSYLVGCWIQWQKTKTRLPYWSHNWRKSRWVYKYYVYSETPLLWNHPKLLYCRRFPLLRLKKIIFRDKIFALIQSIVSLIWSLLREALKKNYFWATINGVYKLILPIRKQGPLSLNSWTLLLNILMIHDAPVILYNERFNRGVLYILKLQLCKGIISAIFPTNSV